VRHTLPAAGGRAALKVVVGIGNAWQGDDGAGLAAARLLRDRVPQGVVVRELEGEPIGLVDAVEGADEAYLVDAVRSGSAAGTVRRIDASRAPVPATLSAASTHTLGVGEAIELARALHRLPRRVVVYGIEVESVTAGNELSAPVERGVHEVVERVVAECTSSR
jgi:hydrogenase maturation protease